MKFNFNSPLMDFMTTTAQFVALNLVFILCCLPIITIGPAIAALYQVTMRETRGEHGYLIRKFFNHMKEMFLQSLLTSILFFIIMMILLFNLVFWNELNGIIIDIVVILIYIMLFLITCTAIYVFPLMARFNNGLLQTIKNAFYLSLNNPKTTIFLLVIHAITVAAIYFFPPSKVFMLLIGFSFLVYCNSYLLNKVFKQYETETELSDKDES